MAHAKLSPSSAHRWMTCPASVIVSEGLEDKGSTFALEGTAAHFLASECLLAGKTAKGFPNSHVGMTATGEWELVNSPTKPYPHIFFTADMADHVQKYLDYVNGIVADTGGMLLVEQSLPLEGITGEQGATGTSDTVILTDNELIIIDLKYGQGVKVEADNNEQLMLYALSALHEYAFYADFEQARLVIHQPRLNHISEWVVSIDDLLAFGDRVAVVADQIKALNLDNLEVDDYCPEAHACQFCKAKATCQPLADFVMGAVANEFDDLTSNDTLATYYSKIGLIKDWCNAIEQATYDKLAQGEPVQGYKLVQGKRGSRKWRDETEAENALKAMRIKADDMYDKKVISPTSAEKLSKAGKLGSTQWGKLQDLIIKSEGKPTIAPVEDKCPAISLVASADEFDDLTA